jgi:hypothetical protein
VLRHVTPPLAEPVALDEAKVHLRVDTAADDALVMRLITAARGLVEAQLRRALVEQTWELSLDAWPGQCQPQYARLPLGHRERAWLGQATVAEVVLPLPPLISAGPITYLGPDLVLNTLDPTTYRVSTGTPGRIRPAPGHSWPRLARVMDAVTVRFIAGYGDPDQVPECLRQAILLLVGHWYQSREAVISGATAAELPLAVQTLLAAEDWGSYV